MRRPVLAGLSLLLGVCCCLFGLVLALTYWGYRFVNSPQVAPLLTEILASPTPSPSPNLVLTPVPTPQSGSADTLAALETVSVPPRDLREIAMRLKGLTAIPEIVSETPANHAVGDEVEFTALNRDTDAHFTVAARLIYKTDNVYFFADERARVNAAAVQELVDEFQNHIYPTNREFFGREWSPGVDGDPRLYILYARGLGGGVLGYYSSVDEYSRLAHEYSNEKEIIYLNADLIAPGHSALPAVLAHEFQHAIHWRADINEETWLNEGAAMLAELLNGYTDEPGGYAASFVARPDLQLNSWTDGHNIPYYGASFLFLTYFLGRFGESATQALIADPANGLRSVDDVLAAQGLADPATGRPLTAVDVFADWVIANYLGDASVGDGRYAYQRYPQAPGVRAPTETIYQCPSDARQTTVHQFAADYYEIRCEGQATLHFTGSRQVNAIPAQLRGGRYVFWSHRTDESDTTLTRAFDLSGLTSATLAYWAWWDIEENFDYLYLEASADGGRTWEILQTPSGTAANPNGSNLGWGYTGRSGAGSGPEWVEETVDLSAYAGQKVLIRFEYVTDAALVQPGFLLDDLALPELNYRADFESGADGWEAAGFVRMDNLLPQRFVVQVIRQGAATTVERVPLDEGNRGSVTLNLGEDEAAVLVVSGATPFTQEVASYQIEIK
jgi:hypothetical protein